jgi:hypothetical protein
MVWLLQVFRKTGPQLKNTYLPKPGSSPSSYRRCPFFYEHSGIDVEEPESYFQVWEQAEERAR